METFEASDLEVLENWLTGVAPPQVVKEESQSKPKATPEQRRKWNLAKAAHIKAEKAAVKSVDELKAKETKKKEVKVKEEKGGGFLAQAVKTAAEQLQAFGDAAEAAYAKAEAQAPNKAPAKSTKTKQAAKVPEKMDKKASSRQTSPPVVVLPDDSVMTELEMSDDSGCIEMTDPVIPTVDASTQVIHIPANTPLVTIYLCPHQLG